MEDKRSDIVYFGEFSLSITPLRLTKSGKLVPLRAQALKLLALLVSRPGELVTHKDIQRSLWNGRVVDFSRSEHVCIRELRATLGDITGSPRFIETVPRWGYRFVASIGDTSPGSDELPARVPQPPKRPIHTLLAAGAATAAMILLGAVMIFRDLGEDRLARPENAAARDAYLRGKFLLETGVPDRIAKSVTYLQNALAVDANHAPAHVSLAEAYRILGDRDRSSHHAARAVEAAPNDADAHVQLAISLMQNDWNWLGARQHVERALAIDPNLARAHHVAASLSAIGGDVTAAVAHMQRAMQLEPVSTLIRADLGWFHFLAGNFDAAASSCRQALDLEPDHLPSLLCIVRAAEAGERFDSARDAALQVMTLWDASEADRSAIEQMPVRDSLRAFHEWRLDFYVTYPDRSAILPEDLAEVYAAAGNLSAAVTHLLSAADAKSPLLPVLLADPLFRPLRQDARFKGLLARLKLDQPIVHKQV